MSTSDPICKVMCKNCADVTTTKWLGFIRRPVVEWRCKSRASIDCRNGAVDYGYCDNWEGDCKRFKPK